MFKNISKIIATNSDGIGICFFSSLVSIFIEIGIFIGFLICSEHIEITNLITLFFIVIVTIIFVFLQYKASLNYIKSNSNKKKNVIL